VQTWVWKSIVNKIGTGFIGKNCTSVKIQYGNRVLVLTIVPCPWNERSPKPDSDVLRDFLKEKGIDLNTCAIVTQNHFVQFPEDHAAFLRWLINVAGGTQKIIPFITYGDANVPPVAGALEKLGLKPKVLSQEYKFHLKYNNVIFNNLSEMGQLDRVYLRNGLEISKQFLELLFNRQVGGAASEESDSEFHYENISK